jgi:hypothetical protein
MQILSAVYFVLASVTTHNIRKVGSPQTDCTAAHTNRQGCVHPTAPPLPDRRLRTLCLQIRSLERSQRGVEDALIVSLVLSTGEACIYVVLSGFTLLGRWCSAETNVGIWYGVMVAMTFTLMWGVLPAAIMSRGYIQVVRCLSMTRSSAHA